MLFVGWLGFLAYYLITKIALYVLAGWTKDSPWGSTVALVA